MKIFIEYIATLEFLINNPVVNTNFYQIVKSWYCAVKVNPALALL